MSQDQDSEFEIHIVSYNDTSLERLPSDFELLEITSSQVALNEVASLHGVSSQQDAEQGFQTALDWAHTTSCDGDFHLKLERFLDVEKLERSEFSQTDYPSLPVGLSYDENIFIGGFGWDVHIDGTFDPRLKSVLLANGWIYLDYKSEHDNIEYTTLTQHFLGRESCSSAFQSIKRFVEASGGFEGLIYWEEPVRYLISSDVQKRSTRILA